WSIDIFINKRAIKDPHPGWDRFDWLSWSRTLSLEFEARRLRYLVFADSVVDMLNASIREPSQAFPDGVHEGLVVGVANTEACGKALEAFHKRMGLWLEELVYSMDQSMSPYLRCNEASCQWPFILNTDHLDRICVPTVVINGRAETVQDFVVEPIYPIGATVQPLSH
ncbi:hypothetical protein EDD85DRAFT_777994, partial [Armillaria nabsnona]